MPGARATAGNARRLFTQHDGMLRTGEAVRLGPVRGDSTALVRLLATTLNSPTCSTAGPFSWMPPRTLPMLPGAPSIYTSELPGLAPPFDAGAPRGIALDAWKLPQELRDVPLAARRDQRSSSMNFVVIPVASVGRGGVQQRRFRGDSTA